MYFQNPFHPPPAPPGFGVDKTVPQPTSSFLNQLGAFWLGPFLEVGFSRPLEKDDLWQLPPSRLTGNTTDALEANFYPRCPPEVRPKAYRGDSATAATPTTPTPATAGRKSGSVADTASETVEAGGAHREKEAEADATRDADADGAKPKQRRFWGKTKEKKPKPEFDSSLFKAVHRTFFWRIWFGGVLKLIGDTLKTTTPLLTKVILTWLTEAYVLYHAPAALKAPGGELAGVKVQGIGYGVGLAVALFAMQEVSSLVTNHSQQIMETVGLSVRTSIIGSVFRKSLRLSPRARIEHTVGQTTTIISTDSVRLDRFCLFGHNIWTSPIQIIIGVGLLINNLGYSALVGLGVLLLGFPLQMLLVRVMFAQRKKGVKITDTRVRLSNEVLQGIRLIKYYAWESFYTHQIGSLREREIATVRKTAIARAALIALVTLIPVLASVLSFITYALSGHDLNIAIIFSSLQFFNIIRAPLIFIPFVLSALSDAIVAFGRIGKFLTAEELPDPYLIEPERKNAVEVDASFAWETAGRLEGGKFVIGGKGKGGKGKGGKGVLGVLEKGELLPTSEKNTPAPSGTATPMPREEEKPFELTNLKFSVPKGAFVAIVGKVGSGKSSILQALIGEMRKTSGTVVFGGTMAYVPQTAWIRNASLRQNVVFGLEDDEDKFRQIIRACNLEHDLEVLPHGEETEARVSLARAAYSDTDIVLLDDPLSAVDSFVGKAILQDCILNGPLADRTRILVTHALHVLDKADYIYVMDNGVIKEQGTYETLMREGVVFSKLMEEYGNLDEEHASGSKGTKKAAAADADQEDVDAKKGQTALMQEEERNIGAVTVETYGKYLKFAGGLVWAPIILLLLTLAQAAQVGNNLFLGFWTGNSIHGFRQGEYMAVYAALGLAQAFFSFLTSFAFALASLMASLNLFKAALAHILRSPASFFDTTPMGRILSRLVKDQDTLDNQLSMTLMQLLMTFASVLGTVGLVFYTFPLLGIIFAPMAILYYLVALYYRRSSVEAKRLDSLMRSALYASYTETLTGLSTIRAYREQEPAIRSAEQGLDLENRAYFMTISLQLWLGLRLDVFGNILVFGIALFAAGFRHTVDPSKIGVVLSYTLSITQVFSQMVSFFAQNEQNMNSVERLIVYAELPAEGAPTTPNDPPPSWPERGEIHFKDVEMAYREGLPLVLKGVNFNVRPGEKVCKVLTSVLSVADPRPSSQVGIVGRTGAGKSSLLQALFRMVELQSGEIDIDGHNIRNVGLDTLRGRLALVPQDSVLFLGTLRENLDPQGTKTDAELISVLQRAWLLPRDGEPPDPVADAKFSLDSTIGDEGSNYSAGEKQLLALCRALVKNSAIIVLDEATSSVDVETDAKLQRTIRTEFASATLLCIAHRLNTIAYYDRILVMDKGEVAEFDTVLNLFDKKDSIFRSLCNEANLQRADILRIRAENAIDTVIKS
ncbi:Oligomycin resistance ATP-dependent permease YOR1 [Mycena sanguinolenta]|uniref:Oligomycin resistance ATP-dependent permease YOR1 n=1 Tax=Mycena sanguinolenta TaxID=230812 RepID=A0A8H6Z6V9_9AGAR|nr:Oligomycin resistance ATP-dependent permease YOR1 [Mycena sanguinolenta]